MITLKRIDKTKMMLYVAIIVVMIGSTVFLIVRNRPAAPEAAILPAEILELGGSVSGSSVHRTSSELKPLDSSIFDNASFLSLKEIIIKPAQSIVGKKNPFAIPVQEAAKK